MSLKGKAKIQLFDGDTGRLAKEIHEENMITGAVDTILNPPDFIELGIGTADEGNRAFNMLQIFEGDLADTAFHGVIVCRDKIDEDPDRMMLPWDNEETGHAGMSTSDQNAFLGTYNANESGVIENGKGYRHVWDFGTDRANGEIGCICLTTKDGGTNGYNNAFENLAQGGLDLNSSSVNSFESKVHQFVGRYVDDKVMNSSEYKWFYLDRLENGDLRLLGKNTKDCAIYEVRIYNPNVLSVNTEKPFCGFTSIQKVIEVFEPPSRLPGSTSDTLYYHTDFYAAVTSSYSSSLSEEDKNSLIENWEANPGWMCYFPYVLGDEIHVIGTTMKHIHHLVYSLSGYTKKSEKVIETDTELQGYNLSYQYVSRSGEEKPYHCFLTASVDTAFANTLGGFFRDDLYFAVTKNPWIDGEQNTDINNFHQMTAFHTDGTSSGKRFQYFDNANLTGSEHAWRGFYADEKTDTPMAVCDGNGHSYMLGIMLRKTSDGYGCYCMRLAVPSYGYSYLNAYANLIKVKDMAFPLYCVQNYPDSSGSSHYFSLAFGIIKPCLTSVNNLSEPVRKLDGQVMKITYDIVEEKT